jgi:hypothetical protein
MASKRASTPAGNPGPEDAALLYRRLIHQAHGPDARIRLLREAPSYGASVFVVDIDNGPRHVRLLGGFRPGAAAPGGDPEVVTLSAMDLIHPTRLELDYMRLMSLAFALCERREKALLLGVGGGDMWRFVRAALPECALTLVELDEDVAAMAQRWFYLTQPAVIMPAQRFVMETSDRFDVLLVDFYDDRGDVVLDPDFWAHCLAALAPGGCIATNWLQADKRTKAMAETQIEAARARGHDCFFVTPRGRRGNFIQFLPTAEGRGRDNVAMAVERFFKEQRLPEANRPDLKDFIISTTFPVGE